MSPSDKIGFLVPLWNASPVVVAAIVFAIDFGMINLLMTYAEHRFRRPRWKSFLYGDSICFPIYAFSAAYALRAMHPSWHFYQQGWWQALLLVIGVAASLGMEKLAMDAGIYNWQQEGRPSKLYHTIIFGPMLYVMAGSGIPLLWEHPNTWSFYVAVASAVCFLFTALVWDGAWSKANPELARQTH